MFIFTFTFFDCRSDFQRSTETQTDTILHIVFEFQVDCACFHGEEASTNFGEQVKEERKKERMEHPQ